MPRHVETIAALATPVGTSALAVLRVTGPDTLRVATEIIGRPPLPRRARHADYCDRAGRLIDDVLLIFFRGPQSYTGEDAMEISCHGNPLIAQKILEDLFARGCRPAEAGEFTQRAFLNGRMDLSQAEAVMDLIHARSERALAAANQQLRGALGRHMNKLVEGLVAVLAQVEAYIDFPEEDLPPENRESILTELARLSAETARLLATSHYGELLRDGIKTVIVGAPNVGKSSLLNRLVGRDRALVSPEPGTTRDFIEERIMIGPHCMRLIDTAGLNPSPAPLENLGMKMTRERLAEADIVLLVLDATQASIPKELAETAMSSNVIIILNKSDLRRDEACDGMPQVNANAISVSALTGAGIQNLVDVLTKRADEFQAELGGEIIAVNARHAQALVSARLGLQDAADGLAGGLSTELVAAELRMALSAYGEVIGKVDNERMLDQLFATFCIGK
jgi:tRNA modification GTPase